MNSLAPLEDQSGGRRQRQARGERVVMPIVFFLPFHLHDLVSFHLPATGGSASCLSFIMFLLPDARSFGRRLAGPIPLAFIQFLAGWFFRSLETSPHSPLELASALRWWGLWHSLPDVGCIRRLHQQLPFSPWQTVPKQNLLLSG